MKRSAGARSRSTQRLSRRLQDLLSDWREDLPRGLPMILDRRAPGEAVPPCAECAVRGGVGVEPAKVADAPALAGITVRAWPWAYRGLLPDSFLGTFSGRHRQIRAWWRAYLRALPEQNRVWVAPRHERVVGFAHTGPARDTDIGPKCAELYAIYLEPGWVGSGIGRILLEHLAADFRRRGFLNLTAWAITGNDRADRFYLAGGWRRDGRVRVQHRPSFAWQEVRYRIDLA